VSGNSISWTICKSAPRPRQTTMPAPYHSVFYMPDALPATQLAASNHWRPNATNWRYVAPVVYLLWYPALSSTRNAQKEFLIGQSSMSMRHIADHLWMASSLEFCNFHHLFFFNASQETGREESLWNNLNILCGEGCKILTWSTIVHLVQKVHKVCLQRQSTVR